MVIYPRKLIPQILQNRAISNESSKCYPKLISTNIIKSYPRNFYPTEIPCLTVVNAVIVVLVMKPVIAVIFIMILGVTSLVWQSSSD